MSSERPRRIVLVNDLGFSPGAGGAARRQMQSLLLEGHDVALVCGRRSHGGDAGAGDPEEFMRVAAHMRGRAPRGRVLGLREFPEDRELDGFRPRLLPVAAIDAIAAFAPYLVVVGNLHAVGWSVGMLESLKSRGLDAVAYMHDMHYATGRCAASFDCNAYLTGCGAECPTYARYPALAPAMIAPEWMLRRRVFVEAGVPLVANSAWTRRMAEEAFGGRAEVGLVRLGLDEMRFKRVDRAIARGMLGLDDAPTVGFGAVDPSAPEKGGPTLARVAEILAGRGIRSVAFGHGSERFPVARSLGFVDDERIMPIVFSALDCFVTASEAETFGQTALEALACGTPVVALRRGGLCEIVEDGARGRLVGPTDPAAIADAAAGIALDPALRDRLGLEGRRFVETHHSLAAQGRAWSEYIAQRAAARSPSPERDAC